MTNPLGTADFFALEAGECLDRLDALVNSGTAPSGEEFLRLARVLRGSALMAGQSHIARAAAGLETLARAHRDHRTSWDPAIREQVAQAIEEFRRLIRRAREWNEADTARAVRLARDLDTLTGQQTTGESAPGRRREPQELNTGVRAFVAREGALVASALDRAARGLRAAPGDREPLYNVLRRMQSLRGLAELSELAPLPDILDGIELAVGDLTRLFAPPPGVDEVMDAAAQALTRISRDVAEHGRPDPDAEEGRRFTELLLHAFAVERDVVPIESLYSTDDPQPVTRPLTHPDFSPPKPLGPLELVSHGEHLCQSADLIAAARSSTERDLRLYHLLGTLRSATGPSPDPVAGALAVFARSAQEALGVGVASHSIPDLVSRLREAGQVLREVVETDDRQQVARRLLDVAHRLDRLRSPEPAEEPVAIESLGYEAEPEVVPVASLAPEPSGLEASFSTLGRLVREQAPTTAALGNLFGTAARPASAAPELPPVGQEPAVAIATLCYSGKSALRRANEVRQQLAAELTRDASLESLQPLLQELLDLVPLALAES